MSASAAAPRKDPYHLGLFARDRSPTTEHGDHDLLSKRIVTGYGFWLFLLSDVVMFSAFFASFVVLRDATAGGPSGREIFDVTNTALETALLLLSSFTCGVAFIGAQLKRDSWYYGAMAATFLLGVGFLLLEGREFAELAAQGYGPSRSAFLSSFFTLVGCHGLHVTLGLLWLLTMMAQVRAKGYRPDIMRRLLCFSLFWHTLDIIWVALFTVVYLIGVAT